MNAHNKEADVLKLLPEIAWLVQSCWLVRSKIFYLKKHKSAFSGIAGRNTLSSRNFTMWKLPQSRSSSVSRAVVQLPTEDLNDIFGQMSRFSPREGCEFLCLYDKDFAEKYPDFVKQEEDGGKCTITSCRMTWLLEVQGSQNRRKRQLQQLLRKLAQEIPASPCRKNVTLHVTPKFQPPADSTDRETRLVEL